MPKQNKASGAEGYLEEIKERGKKSRVYREYQLIGLLIAQILNDEKHKSLYIKLAKKGGSDKLLQLAKSVAERKRIKNKGAYFMKLLEVEGKKKGKRGGIRR